MTSTFIHPWVSRKKNCQRNALVSDLQTKISGQTLLWSNSESNISYNCAPVIANVGNNSDYVIIPFTNYEFKCFHGLSGSEVWSFTPNFDEYIPADVGVAYGATMLHAIEVTIPAGGYLSVAITSRYNGYAYYIADSGAIDQTDFGTATLYEYSHEVGSDYGVGFQLYGTAGAIVKIHFSMKYTNKNHDFKYAGTLRKTLIDYIIKDNTLFIVYYLVRGFIGGGGLGAGTTDYQYCISVIGIDLSNGQEYFRGIYPFVSNQMLGDGTFYYSDAFGYLSGRGIDDFFLETPVIVSGNKLYINLNYTLEGWGSMIYKYIFGNGTLHRNQIIIADLSSSVITFDTTINEFPVTFTVDKYTGRTSSRIFDAYSVQGYSSTAAASNQLYTSECVSVPTIKPILRSYSEKVEAWSDTYDLMSTYSKPTVANEYVVSSHDYTASDRTFIFINDYLYCYDSTGAVEWTYQVGDDVLNNPTIRYFEQTLPRPSGNPGETTVKNIPIVIYTTETGLLGSYETEDCGVGDIYTWEISTGISTLKSPIITKNGIIFNDAVDTIYFYDFTGNLKSFYEVDLGNYGNLNDIAIGNSEIGNVYGVTTDGYVFGLSAIDPYLIVSSITPEKGKSEVQKYSTIVITFSRLLNEATIANNITIAYGDGANEVITYTYSIDETNARIMTITPDVHMQKERKVNITITAGESGLKSIENYAMLETYTSYFYTGYTILLPEYVDDIIVNTEETSSQYTDIEFQCPNLTSYQEPWAVHFKITSYTDSGKLTTLETKNTVDNCANFSYSTDNGMTWTAYPAGGLTNYDSIIKCQLDTGIKEGCVVVAEIGADPV